MKDSVLDIGGQAVIEGVLMKTKDSVAVAVRRPNGKIVTKIEKIRKLPKFLVLPFIRGVTTLFQITIIGIKALTWSANQAVEKEEELSNMELFWTLLSSFAFGILFFVGVPFFVTKFLKFEGFSFPLVEGIVRIFVFIAYLAFISVSKEVRRLFQYHGAEHMVVNCFENKEKLTTKNVVKYSTVHQRCGTTFLALVLIVSVFVFTLVHSSSWIINLVYRIVLIPVVAGISFEVLKIGGRYPKNFLIRIITWPGRLVQKITTKRPSKEMVEVAIVSLKTVLKL